MSKSNITFNIKIAIIYWLQCILCPCIISFYTHTWCWNCFDNQLNVDFSSKMTNISWICCFSLSYLIVNWIYFGLGPLVTQNKTFRDVTLSVRKLWWAFFTIFWYLMDQTTDKLIKKWTIESLVAALDTPRVLFLLSSHSLSHKDTLLLNMFVAGW